MHMQGQHNQGGFNQMGGQQINQNQPKFGTPSAQGQNNQSMVVEWRGGMRSGKKELQTPQIKNEPSFDDSHSRAPSNASAMSNGPTSSSSLPNGMPPRQASDAGEKRLNIKV